VFFRISSLIRRSYGRLRAVIREYAPEASAPPNFDFRISALAPVAKLKRLFAVIDITRLPTE
jgi:hypothetical protein